MRPPRTLDAPRLPGVNFLPPPRAAGVGLPPLDVAAFVGYAERGPLHTPVALEDPATYRAVFGGDLPLALDTGERVVYANLPGAVAAFFANGGRRCVVVRVAGPDAAAARFRLPHTVALGDDPPRLAAVSAASPGAWANRLRLATRLRPTFLPAAQFSWATPVDGTSLLVSPAPGRPGLPVILPGDLLRLSDAGGRRLFPVARVAPQGDGLRLWAERSWALPDDLVAGPPLDVVSAERLTIEGPRPLATTGRLLSQGDDTLLPLAAADAGAAGPGDVLQLALSDGADYLFAIARLIALHDEDPATAATVTTVAVARELLCLTPAAPGPGPFVAVEQLRFDLSLSLGDERQPPLSDLAFNAGHPRAWGDNVLLESSLLFRRPAARPAPAGVDSPGALVAAWFRELTRDPFDWAAVPVNENAPEPAAPPDPTLPLAGLLAPLGSGLSLSPAATDRALALQRVAEEPGLTYLPLGMPALFDAAPTGAGGPQEGWAGNDDLATFDIAPFLDDYLRGEPVRLLPATAFDRRYWQHRPLRGLHSLFFNEEVALLSLPDAAHRAWQPDTPLAAPPPPRTARPPEATPCPVPADFVACDRPPTVRDVLPYFGRLAGDLTATVLGDGFAAGATPRVFFGRRPAEAVVVISDDELTCRVPAGALVGPVVVRVETDSGTGELAEGFIYTADSTRSPLPAIIPFGAADEDASAVAGEPLLALQAALINFCLARRDVLAVLSLPRHYETRHCLAWQTALRARLGLPPRGLAAEGAAEIADLSFAAVYHPWLLVADRQATDGVRATPPDGALCGLIAAHERARGVWIAPANQPLRGVLGLEPDLSTDDWADLFADQFNLVRREAKDFRPMSAHTLSDERILLQISVRRLLILLRKMALALGMNFVFESNHERFREGARVLLSDMLRQLHARGALAGQTAAQAFRVVTDASVNPPQSVEQGRFVAQLQVAPSQPMEFITVLLSRSAEETQLTEI